MTDPIDCPDCAGTGEQRLGELVMACQFCAGRGWVGGEFEPAEEPSVNPDVPTPPVWQLPGAREGVCKQCQGFGVVLRAGGGTERVTHFVEMPCPACQSWRNP